MKMQGLEGDLYFRLIGISILLFFMSSCGLPIATKPYEPPKTDRTYIKIAAADLYPLIETAFISAGFQIAERDYARGYLKTSWKEYDGDRHGLVRWRERRMYVAFFDIDRLNGRHLLILQLAVQEKAPVASDWRNKQVSAQEDSEYQIILKELDNAVRNRGGLTA